MLGKSIHTPDCTQQQTYDSRHASRTYDDEEDEIDEVVEGVSVHDVVHDVHPTLQCDDLKPVQRFHVVTSDHV